MKRVYKSFCINDEYYVYDRGVNQLLRIPQEDYELLSEIKTDEEFEANADKLKRYIEKGFFTESKLKTIKNSEEDNVEVYLDNKIEQITLQVTQNCNLRCQYCVYVEEKYHNRGHNNKKMDFEMAKKGIDYLLEHSHGLKKIDISFYGGEPLLELDLIRKCVEYANNEVEGKKIKYNMTTNGTLLTEEVAKFCMENDFTMTISLDGTKETHNQNRKFANGQGSFDVIMKNLKNIKEKYPEFLKRVMFNTVVAPKNDYGCIKNFLETDEVLEDSLIMTNRVSDLYNDNATEGYDEKFYVISRYGYFKALLAAVGKLDRKYVSKLFKVDIEGVKKAHEILEENVKDYEVGHPGGPCLAGVTRLFLNANGNFYPCERVSEKSEVMRIGNVDEGIDLEKVKDIISIGKITKESCIGCWAFHYCTMCAATCDELDCFSSKKRLQKCEAVKAIALENLKDVCLLSDFNFDFEGEQQ